ncbi:DUF411 domain-containing protein [Jannaschia donghaensis]|uniref:Metal-binding protein n=1 Tax=Jannaschia donghaensis TaxID=420998 RepID=A0A0M6YF32_9RHOB|nr:DUF411 domain-containing protein [Jannaschia donghaensis]CTQ48544.1 Protein of unknown function, DUF [Jannaschia donghaensis]
MITRRNLLARLGAATFTTAVLPIAGTAAPTDTARPPLHILTAPGCSCCHAWADLARARGHVVTVEEMTDTAAQKNALGVPEQLVSCHTIRAEGYVFEGHVPFDALDAVLRDRPAIAGLAVPGMPMGSPGMGDDPAARFDVIAFGGAAGDGRVFYRAGTNQPFAG